MKKHISILDVEYLIGLFLFFFALLKFVPVQYILIMAVGVSLCTNALKKQILNKIQQMYSSPEEESINNKNDEK